MKRNEQITQLNKFFGNKPPEELLRYFLDKYGRRIALASSLGIEDQILTDMMAKIDPSVRIFTIDTGRLFPETYSLMDKTVRNYHIKLEVFFPESNAVESYVQANGINGFYETVDKRKACCHVRKIQPLLRALSTLDVWICGLRKEQSTTRIETQMVEWDEVNRLIKINPLIRWTNQDVRSYVQKHNVPIHPLHLSGYPSIGCQPCTRPVEKGEDIRAGRWWWESPEHKECGLHRR
jgi:phosphoadenosine phosphosulfate reductase